MEFVVLVCVGFGLICFVGLRCLLCLFDGFCFVFIHWCVFVFCVCYFVWITLLCLLYLGLIDWMRFGLGTLLFVCILYCLCVVFVSLFGCIFALLFDGLLLAAMI